RGGASGARPGAPEDGQAVSAAADGGLRRAADHASGSDRGEPAGGRAGAGAADGAAAGDRGAPGGGGGGAGGAGLAVLRDLAASAYFGHLRLREKGRGDRDVLIGRTTHIDAKADVRIVDWRHAPVSQLYYRYEEGTEYEETFGERDVEGTVLARRTVTIDDGA